MKTPVQTKYYQINPTEDSLFEEQKKIIEELLNKNIFVLPYEKFSSISPKLKIWLSGYGWQIAGILRRQVWAMICSNCFQATMADP